MAEAVVETVCAPAQMDNLINKSNLEKIESFLNDTQYKEALESSANYNTRLCIERRMRLPFIDTQTGVAQNHSSLFMHPRQRIPGLLPGQIYSYPRPRWRKKRRQYLTMHSRVFARAADSILDEGEMHSISQMENPALQDTDSKDSQLLLKDEVPKVFDSFKEWYYDEQDMLEMEAFDEPDPDSDLDYEETYKKGRRKKGAGRGRGTESPSTPGRKKGGGRGRKKGGHSFEPTPGDPDKPFACELCGARYKTRPGLTYHYGHSHKEGASDENSRDSNAPTPTQMGVAMPPGPSGIPGPYPPAVPGQAVPPMQGGMPPLVGGMGDVASPASPHGGVQNPGQVYQDSYVSFLNQTPGTQPRPPQRGRTNQVPPMVSPGMPQPPMNMPQVPPSLPPNLPPSQSPIPSHQQLPPATMVAEEPQMPVLQPENPVEAPPPGPVEPPREGASKAGPSPYCDFCLGDSRENKKTGIPEELVSCSDCGRSGHPSCLQFTPNMMISVKKYRWQCIECKCCSMCGNSDNDDQLLFCDDCDRGYHMYCLAPPLENPPEGSWSCNLCIDLFHK